MAGITSIPIAATPLTADGTANGAVSIASVQNWLIGSHVALADNTTTQPIVAVIVGIITATNTLLLHELEDQSFGWQQQGFNPQGLPPQLPEASKNPTNMSAWLVANSATVSQISTFIYAATSDFFKKKKSGPSHFWTLNGPVASNGAILLNSRSTPAYLDVNGDGSVMQLLGPGSIRVEPNGIRQENATTNFLYYSQLIGFNDGTNGWISSFITTTTNSADLTAPDGTQTATKIVYPTVTAGGYAFVGQNAGLSATNSVYLRTLTGTATIYLANNSVGYYQTCNVTSTWQRFVLPYDGSGTYIILGCDNRSGNSDTPLITACTVYAWGAQAETTAFPTSYFPTQTNVILYSDNLVLLSQNLVTTSGAPNWNGLTDAFKVTAATGGPAYNYRLIVNNFTATVPTAPFTASIYLKDGNGQMPFAGLNNSVSAYVSFDLTNGTIVGTSGGTISGTITPVGGGWYRCTYTNTAAGDTYICCNFANAAANLYYPAGWTATGTEYVYASYPQIEPGTQPSSYFSTGATLTTTRSRDNYSIANPLFGLNPTNWSWGALMTPLGTWSELYYASTGISLFIEFGNQVNANTMRGYISGYKAGFDVWDATATVETVTDSANTVNGASATPLNIAYFNKAGVQTFTPVAGSYSYSGAGTGVITTQDPNIVAFGFTSDPYNFQGWFKNMFVDKS